MNDELCTDHFSTLNRLIFSNRILLKLKNAVYVTDIVFCIVLRILKRIYVNAVKRAVNVNESQSCEFFNISNSHVCNKLLLENDLS